ncbi:unnamed protein product [Nezara viridula]|uniref:Uncharacterized protein n=1 Tax=Nezara viridula TaxID=85310 RepID=A0A9P0H5A7_NEZVI|nr:unnamed protein product [Nezara viridula]
MRPLKAFAINPQLGVKDSVVNIPIDIGECLHTLPRSFNEMATIQLQLKRHILHKTYYIPGTDKDKLTVLLCAPSGKAAFLIHGVSVHTAFALPVTQFSDVEDGLVNGACGELEMIMFRPQSSEPYKLFLNFSETAVGHKARSANKSFMENENIASHLTPIDKNRQILNISNKLEQQVVREQFPLVCAEALT